MVLIAVSSVEIMSMATPPVAPLITPLVPVTAAMVVLVAMLAVLTVSRSVVALLAPIWKVRSPALPARIAWPLNRLLCSVRSTSSASWRNSSFRLSLFDFV